MKNAKILDAKRSISAPVSLPRASTYRLSSGSAQ